MTEWSDTGLSLGLKRFGESGAILDAFCRTKGRSRGMVYGGASRGKRAAMQAGNTLALTWKARTTDQLGFFAMAEPERERGALHMADGDVLAGMAAATELLLDTLPEGEPKPGLYDATETLLDAMDHPDIWPALFVRWEAGVLAILGYGLDLSSCAISGATYGLTHVSPRSGRAVRGEEAGEYLDRLLKLPQFLLDSSAEATPGDVADGFRLTGHFLIERLFSDLNRPAPESRYLMIDRLERAGKVAKAST